MGLPFKNLANPINTCFAYLIHYLHYILESKGTINYLFGLMENIPEIIREQKPSLMDWSVPKTIVTTIWQIVGIIVKKWPLVVSDSYTRQLFIL